MRYYLIAGEASGDLHASNLMRELKEKDSSAEFCFLGGDLMLSQGGKLVKHYRDMAFMGFISVLKNWRKIANNFKACKETIHSFNPDVVILIDYPSFNLRIAKYVKKNLNIPVFYYISPKIWAWKEFRVKQIKRFVDKMFTILPFETEFYQKHDYAVQYVGNPTVDSISEYQQNALTQQEFCERNNLSHQPIIALLAGSRKQEIMSCLPTMIDGVRKFADYQVVISGAPGISTDFYNHFTKENSIPVVFDQTYDLVSNAQAAVVNSGTATLETALLSTPQVVVYQVDFGKMALLLKDVFLKVKFISLVNLIAQKEVVKELIGSLFTSSLIEKEINQILTNKTYRQSMLENYQLISNQLGDFGAAKNAAVEIIKALKK
jgi:lipid-A-disaccharide synthase